jgi:redox-sensitive bicupin YhaK (pirin superfamily)
MHPQMQRAADFQHYPADVFPTIHPIHWLTSHFAVGGWSPLQRLSGMLTAHMTRIAPRNGFTWHPHRGLEIYTWVLEGTVYHEDTTGGKGEIGPGEFQRMFSGEYIEHQELNLYDDPARVIQIWFAADVEHIGLKPHYQQPRKSEFPMEKIGDATVTSLIGVDSPMEQHMKGRITAATIPAGGASRLVAPNEDEDLFLYVTDGSGMATNGHEAPLGQYDVILARPQVEEVAIHAAEEESLHYLSFYLPKFLA